MRMSDQKSCSEFTYGAKKLRRSRKGRLHKTGMNLAITIIFTTKMFNLGWTLSASLERTMQRALGCAIYIFRLERQRDDMIPERILEPIIKLNSHQNVSTSRELLVSWDSSFPTGRILIKASRIVRHFYCFHVSELCVRVRWRFLLPVSLSECRSAEKCTFSYTKFNVNWKYERIKNL